MEAVTWKFVIPLLWLAQAISSPTPIPGDAASPISAVYSWAQLLALLTDRALWLLFLGLILWLGWWLIKRKEAEIADLAKKLEEQYAWQQDKIEVLAEVVSNNTKILDRLDRKL